MSFTIYLLSNDINLVFVSHRCRAYSCAFFQIVPCPLKLPLLVMEVVCFSAEVIVYRRTLGPLLQALLYYLCETETSLVLLILFIWDWFFFLKFVDMPTFIRTPISYSNQIFLTSQTLNYLVIIFLLIFLFEWWW